MISDELFEVLYNIKGGLEAHNTKLIINGECPLRLNDVACKCKEWALTEGFVIYSSCKSASIYKDLEYLYSASNESTESEAIFNAGQWVLDKLS